MRNLKLIILLMLTTLSPIAFANYDFSSKQVANMTSAYKYAKAKGVGKHVNASRIDFGYIMAAILWQESSAGINCGKNGHAVGPFQNYIPTVKSRLAQQGQKKSTAQITNELSNFYGSAHWAKVELEYWLGQHNGNVSKALASYNAGWNTSKGASYSNSVLKKASYLKNNNVLKIEN